MTIKYTSNRLSAKEAEAVGRELEKLAANQELTPAAVLQAARFKKSPLHKHIEWDESKAAESYRLVQAAWLIRTVKVEVGASGDNSSARAFVRVTTSGEQDEGVNEEQQSSPFSMYVPLQAALASPDWRGEILNDARRELGQFRRKYSMLAELAGVLGEIDKLLTSKPAA